MTVNNNLPLYNIRIVTTQKELEAVFRLRYELFVNEHLAFYCRFIEGKMCTTIGWLECLPAIGFMVWSKISGVSILKGRLIEVCSLSDNDLGI